MYNNRKQCDSCTKLLKGKEGSSFVNIDHLHFKGHIDLMTWQNMKYRWNFANLDNDDGEPLAFCNTKCFAEFLNARIIKATHELGKIQEEQDESLIRNTFKDV